MASQPPFKRQESYSYPPVDECGLPLDADVVTPVASSAHNSLGESSNNRSRSVGMGFLAPPPLISRPSIEFKPRSSAPLDSCGLMIPPPLKKASHDLKRDVDTLDSSRLFQPSKASEWIIAPGSVEYKPDFWPLDPMSKMIMNSDPQSIAKSISDCLRRRNIASSFGKTKPKAKCVTSEGVEFRIRLYAGKGNFSGGVIVEVQRRNGWSPKYHKDCQAILESADCASIGDCDDSLMGDNDPFCTFDHTPEKPTLLLSKQLLCSSSQDSLVLGLESVSSMTDPKKYGHDLALSTARALFLNEENAIVKDVLREIIINKRFNGDDLTMLPEKTQRTVFDLTLKAIVAPITLLAKESSFFEVLKHNKWIESDLISILMHEIHNPSCHGHISAMSSKCLRNITINSSGAANAAIRMGVLNVLEK